MVGGIQRFSRYKQFSPIVASPDTPEIITVNFFYNVSGYNVYPDAK
jgi:hypothetical protein